jgi:hypothetical protein
MENVETMRHIESVKALSCNTCTKNVTHDYQISSTPHSNQDHKIVEHTTEFPLSQGALLVDPCDKEELCDISLFTTSPQLDGGHTLVSCSALNILQENEIQLALSEETIPEPSPTCENKNCIDEMPFVVCSALLDLTTSFTVPRIDKKVTYIEANNTIYSFSPVDHMLQVNFQEGEPCLLTCASVDVPDLCSNRFEKALFPNSNNNAKLRTVCSQDGENGIECFHIKFTLAEDVYESRTTQKYGKNAEYMFESRTTQMQEGENDEDITNMDTPTLVAYNSKIKLSLA